MRINYGALQQAAFNEPANGWTMTFAKGAVDGAYWLRKPGANPDLIVAYQVNIAPEVIRAAGRIRQDRRDVGVLAVALADRMNAGWTAAKRARQRRYVAASSRIEPLQNAILRKSTILSVIDGHPLTLDRLESVAVHPTVSLGVEHFGRTGTIQDLYR